MEQPTSRRRSKRNDSPESDAEKRRGRPRVDKQDDSAGDPKDRRRLQIRMAQRAYRQRKESTLEELRKRVSDLSKTIELMNKSFLECRDRLYASSFAGEQMRDLQAVANQFEGYVKDARNPRDDDIPITTAPAKGAESARNPPKALETPVGMVGEATSVNEWLDQGAVANAAKPRAARAEYLGMGYEISYPELSDNAQSIEYPFRLPNSNELVPSRTIASSSFDAANLANLDENFFSLRQIELPRTYSFQESTFGRRLRRAASENAYQMLLDPHRKPSEYERIFQLSLMGNERSKLLSRLRLVLAKGPHEELYVGEPPLIHVGGAGTHYAKRDAYGNLLPKKKANYIGMIGPQTLAMIEEAARRNMSADVAVEVAGYEGEWFDPDDVQGYLEEKGIFIEPSSSFAEAEVLDWPPPSTRTSSISVSLPPHTPVETIASGQDSASFHADQSDGFNMGSVDAGQWGNLDDMELGAIGFSDAQMGSWMNFLQPGEGIKEFNPNAPLGQTMSWEALVTETPPNPMEKETFSMNNGQLQRQKKNVVLDVSKFIEVLVLSGICLGRAPGFRKRDVDRALRIASFGSS